jgi:hypothetical protein
MPLRYKSQNVTGPPTLDDPLAQNQEATGIWLYIQTRLAAPIGQLQGRAAVLLMPSRRTKPKPSTVSRDWRLTSYAYLSAILLPASPNYSSLPEHVEHVYILSILLSHSLLHRWPVASVSRRQRRLMLAAEHAGLGPLSSTLRMRTPNHILIAYGD